jgi:hypothetical protein
LLLGSGGFLAFAIISTLSNTWFPWNAMKALLIVGLVSVFSVSLGGVLYEFADKDD